MADAWGVADLAIAMGFAATDLNDDGYGDLVATDETDWVLAWHGGPDGPYLHPAWAARVEGCTHEGSREAAPRGHSASFCSRCGARL